MWRLFFRRSWLAGLLLAASLADRGNAAPFDFDTLKTIPLMDVVRLATIRYDSIFYVDDAHKALILKEIDGLDPKVRTLAWLAILESDVVERTIQNGAPTRSRATATSCPG